MEKAVNKINAAYQLISRISVSGDAVDVLAKAREYLREAYKYLTEKKEAEPDGGQRDFKPSGSVGIE